MCKLQIKMILLENALRASVSVFGSALLCGEGPGEEKKMWKVTDTMHTQVTLYFLHPD